MLNLLNKLFEEGPLSPKPWTEAQQGQPIEDDSEGDVDRGKGRAQDPDLALVDGIARQVRAQLVLNLFKSFIGLKKCSFSYITTTCSTSLSPIKNYLHALEMFL